MEPWLIVFLVVVHPSCDVSTIANSSMDVSNIDHDTACYCISTLPDLSCLWYQAIHAWITCF